jgi:hypothetical protein
MICGEDVLTLHIEYTARRIAHIPVYYSAIYVLR